LEIESLIERAEKLKEKSLYHQSLNLFKKAFHRYKKKCDTQGILRCMLALGDIYRMSGNFDLAAVNYSEAINLAKKHKEQAWLSDAKIGLGLSLRAQGKWRESIKLIRESERTYNKQGDREGIAFSLWAEAGALRIKGSVIDAIRTFKASLEKFKRLKSRQGIGYCLCGLGGASRIAGHFNDSLIYYTAANKLFSDINDIFGIAYSHCGIGNALRMLDDYKNALVHFAKATTLYKKIGDRVSYSYTIWGLGSTYKMMGNFKKARDNFIKAMLLFNRTKDQRGLIYCKLALGELDFLEGKKANAMRQLRAALCESMKNGFAIEKCHAAVILSFINENNPPTPYFKEGHIGVKWEQAGFSGNIDDRCYNKLGLKLKFHGLPFNMP
jgi:tetratricopeptide (TPR) repeat protein